MRDNHAGPHGEGLNDVTQDYKELALTRLTDEVNGLVRTLDELDVAAAVRDQTVGARCSTSPRSRRWSIATRTFAGRRQCRSWWTVAPETAAAVPGAYATAWPPMLPLTRIVQHILGL
jgi:hypothetical protein